MVHYFNLDHNINLDNAPNVRNARNLSLHKLSFINTAFFIGLSPAWSWSISWYNQPFIYWLSPLSKCELKASLEISFFPSYKGTATFLSPENALFAGKNLGVLYFVLMKDKLGKTQIFDRWHAFMHFYSNENERLKCYQTLRSRT